MIEIEFQDDSTQPFSKMVKACQFLQERSTSLKAVHKDQIVIQVSRMSDIDGAEFIFKFPDFVKTSCYISHD